MIIYCKKKIIISRDRVGEKPLYLLFIIIIILKNNRIPSFLLNLLIQILNLSKKKQNYQTLIKNYFF